uniref:Uncharacterized protein n=1 Tax=Glossina pallidipes TaxID=7398 RepID=A0A1A9ZW86_GLOPL
MPLFIGHSSCATTPQPTASGHDDARDQAKEINSLLLLFWENIKSMSACLQYCFILRCIAVTAARLKYITKTAYLDHLSSLTLLTSTTICQHGSRVYCETKLFQLEWFRPYSATNIFFFLWLGLVSISAYKDI